MLLRRVILYAKILAILDSRFNIAKDDINTAAPAVLRHRMILNFEGQAEDVSPDDIVADLIQTCE